jgi:hypothetical protein
MELSELQKALQGYVLAREPDISGQIEPGRHRNHERRLGIYYDAYRLRLAEALAGDYETLAALMGPQSFRAMCLAYAEARPSQTRNVRWYGGGLSDFLASTPPWQDNRLLSECARFEWTLTLAFDAADAPHVSFESLSALHPQSWETLSLHLHPSVHRLPLHSNVAAIRRAMDGTAGIPETTWNDSGIDWVVWRKEMAVYFRSLAPLESTALRAAAAGASFAELCATLAESLPEGEVARQAAGLLRDWIDDRLISAVSH